MPKTRRVTLRLGEERAKQIDEICERSGCTRSDFITGAINSFMEEGGNEVTGNKSDVVGVQKVTSRIAKEQNEVSEPIAYTELGEPIIRCTNCGRLLALGGDFNCRVLGEEERIIPLARALSKELFERAARS